MAERLTDKIWAWCAEAAEEVDQGEGLVWDGTIFLHPQHGTCCYLAWMLPGAILGTSINHGAAIPNPQGIDREGIFDLFKTKLIEMREQRSQQLAEDVQGLDLKNGFNPGGGLHSH